MKLFTPFLSQFFCSVYRTTVLSSAAPTSSYQSVVYASSMHHRSVCRPILFFTFITPQGISYNCIAFNIIHANILQFISLAQKQISFAIQTHAPYLSSSQRYPLDNPNLTCSKLNSWFHPNLQLQLSRLRKQQLHSSIFSDPILK